jgi:putative Mn2+ efflux pump MntP
MNALLFNGVLLSLDSLLASLAMGPLLASWRQRWGLAALFGGCDALAVCAGAAWGRNDWALALASPLAALYALALGVCCLAAACGNQRRAKARWVFVLPVLLSLDNLAYGAGAGPAGGAVASQAIVLGFISFALALAGLLPWGVIRLGNARSKELIAGSALVLLCSRLLFT